MTIITTPPSVPDLLGTSPADLVQYRDLPESTAAEAAARANRIRGRLDSYIAIRQDIADAYAARDWAALDYDSWAEYVLAEYGPELQRLARAESRVERPVMVADLRSQGMSTRQIGAAVGVTEGTVRSDLAKVRSDYAPEATPTAGEAKKAAPVQPERVTGADGKSYPAKREPKPEPPQPADPAIAEAREKAKQEARDRDAGRTWAARIVPDLQTAVVTIGIAMKLGEPDLITEEMVRQCREAVDLLEAMLKGEK